MNAASLKYPVVDLDGKDGVSFRVHSGAASLQSNPLFLIEV